MSDLSADAARWADLIAGMPQRVASTAKTQADIAQIYQGEIPYQQAETQGIYQGQIPLAQAQAAEARAKVPYWGAEAQLAGAQAGALAPPKPTTTSTAPLPLYNPSGTGSGYGGGGGGGGGSTAAPIGDRPDVSPDQGAAIQPGLVTQPGPGYRPPNAPSDQLAAAVSRNLIPTRGGTQLAMATQPGVMSDVGPFIGYTQTQPTDTTQPPPGPGSRSLAISGMGPEGPAPTTPPPPPAALPPQTRPQQVRVTPDGRIVVQPPSTQLAQAGGRIPSAADAITGDEQNGEYVPGVGIVPHEMAANYRLERTKGDPVTALTNLRDQRNGYLLQRAYGVVGPQAWNDAVEQEYRQGYLSITELNKYIGHPELQGAAIRELTPPGEVKSLDATMAANKYEWNGYEYVFSPRLVADQYPKKTDRGWTVGNRFYPEVASPADIARQSGQPTLTGLPGGATSTAPPPTPQGPAPQGPPPNAPPVTTPPPGGATGPGPQSQNANPYTEYAGRVGHHESGGVSQPNAQGSGANGVYQFMPGTFGPQMRKLHPELTGGLTDDQIESKFINANNGDYEREAMAELTKDNAATLRRNGIPSTQSALFMAHWIGADRLASVLKYPWTTRLSDIPGMNSAIYGKDGRLLNPQLSGNTTVRGLVGYAKDTVGSRLVTDDDINNAGRTDVAGPPMVRTPPPPAPANAPAQQPPPAQPAGGPPPGTPTGKPEVGAGVDKRLDQDSKDMDADFGDYHEAASAARIAGSNQQLLLDARNHIQNGGAGAGTEFAAGIENIVHSFTPDFLARWIKDLSGKDPAKMSGSERYDAIKELTTLAIQQEAQIPGVRPGYGLTTMIAHSASPNIDMPERSVIDMANGMLIRNQAIRDFAATYQPNLDTRRQAWKADNVANPYQRVTPEVETAWNDPNGIHAPKVYQAATDILNGKNFGDWAQKFGLTREQAAEATAIVKRADGNFAPADEQRTPMGYKWPGQK